MNTKADQIEEQLEVKRYKIQYPVSAYTFSGKVLIHRVAFDDVY